MNVFIYSRLLIGLSLFQFTICHSRGSYEDGYRCYDCFDEDVKEDIWKFPEGSRLEQSYSRDNEDIYDGENNVKSFIDEIENEDNRAEQVCHVPLDLFLCKRFFDDLIYIQLINKGNRICQALHQ